jgi:hypothetical protein
MPVHGIGMIRRIAFQDVERDIHHDHQTPTRLLKRTPEFPVPVIVRYNLDLLDVRCVCFHGGIPYQDEAPRFQYIYRLVLAQPQDAFGAIGGSSLNKR